MGIFGRLFGKKEEDLDLGPLPGEEKIPSLEKEPVPKEPLGLEEKPVIPGEPSAPTELPPHLEEPETPAFKQAQPIPPVSPRDIELLNSKLDTLKAILNSMDQRIANLEKAAGVEQQKKMPW